MPEEIKKPMIVFTKNSPFYAVDVPVLQNAHKDQYEISPVTALCRCGSSQSKPYCDGTHIKIGFSGDKGIPKVHDRLKEYRGKHITVYDRRLVCSHDGTCIRELSSVFNIFQRPWIQPDKAPVEKVIEICKKCPSGALSYKLQGERIQNFDRPPVITVAFSGPYEITGFIELKGDQNQKPECAEHYTLCRCGISQNKPFCDGSHFSLDMEDMDEYLAAQRKKYMPDFEDSP